MSIFEIKRSLIEPETSPELNNNGLAAADYVSGSHVKF